RRGPWVPEEDHELLQLVHSQGPNNWVRISQHMKFRSPKQCRERFHQNLKPSLNHDPISPEEGLLIERMVADMGKRWAEIARRLGNRSDNAVKNWWNGSMNRKKRRAVPRDHPYHAHSHSHSHSHSPGYHHHHHHHHRAASASASPACAPAWLPAARRPSSSRYPRDDAWPDRPRSPRTASSTSTTSTTARHLPPLFTLDFSSHIDLPLTSPCYSEVSNRTPSMVSDHASVASASSPRTLTSPALPADALQHHHHHSHYSQQQQQQHYDARRRGSAPAVGMTPVGKSLAAYATSRPALHHHQSVGSMGSLCRLPSSGPDARDARMGLNNLLN
ncbi:hypothetical protein LOZ51_001794, partial [Ophidiomyces ophidiicola]